MDEFGIDIDKYNEFNEAIVKLDDVLKNENISYCIDAYEYAIDEIKIRIEQLEKTAR